MTTGIESFVPFHLERDVSLTKYEGRKQVKKWSETVITLKMQLRHFPKVNPLLFKIFPELMSMLFGKKEGDPDQTIDNILKTEINDVFESRMEYVIKLLSITLEETEEWVGMLDPIDGLHLFGDWIAMNRGLLTAKSSSNGDGEKKKEP